MAVKDNAQHCPILEQIIELGCGLTVQFEMAPNVDGGVKCITPRMRLFGESLPNGNYEVVFGRDGVEVGSGFYTQGLCKPTWTTEIDGE